MNTTSPQLVDTQPFAQDEAAHEALGQRIAMLSSPSQTSGVQASLWKQALAAARSEAPPHVQRAMRASDVTPASRTAKSTFYSMRTKLAIGSVAALLAISGGLLVIPALGKARASARAISYSNYSSDSMTKYAPPSTSSPVPLPIQSTPSVSASSALSANANDRMATPSPDATRMLVQQASLEIVTKDVRGTFARAQALLRSDLGEYVQQSNLTGSAARDAEGVSTLTGSLVIRVRHDRMQETLGRLRSLAEPHGSVRSEVASASDVTDQAVDLDARISSEQRLETELLRLVETRGQLSELLELRTRLATVRESIERLQAKRDSLARQVSYATISLTLIDANETPVREGSATTWTRVGKTFASAWHDGLDALVGVLAFLLRMLVGGLPLWLAAGLGIWIARAMWRKNLARKAREPVPFASE